ncbi:20308_t:CDS:10 [Rhizophagus irregularis]|nr:20308_t:CDS:10 [Rhizophagus irregularis]
MSVVMSIIIIFITSKNRQQKSSSLIAKSQKIPSSPIIHPVPLLRTPSSSSITTHTTPSSNFVFENDDITQQLAEESELLYLQLPEDVKSILDKLRILQRSEKSLTFDQQLPNGEWQSPFATLEAAMMSILLLTPTLLLTNSPKSPLKDDDYMYDSPSGESPVNRYFYKNHQNNSSRSSHISSMTYHSDFSSKSTDPSTSITKKSSLCKVLSASSLLTYIVRTILSMHNETLITCLINRELLDYYNSLTGHVTEEADIVLTQIHQIRSLVRHEEIASHTQNVYDKLITHSNRLVDAINLFVNFIHKQLPVVYEEPLDLQSTNTNEDQSNKNSHSSTTSLLSFELGPPRTRTKNDTRSINSLDSNKSSTSILANHSRSKKNTLPEPSKPRKPHLASLSRENRKGDYDIHDGHLKDNIPPQNVPPISPMRSNSRFKEQLEGPSLKPGILLGRRRLSDVSGTHSSRNLISSNSNTIAAKSYTSLIDSGFKNNKDVDVFSPSRSRRSSNSSIKSYLIKQVHSLSSKGKSSTLDSTSKSYNNYWPVTEDVTSYPDLSYPHSPTLPSKSSSRSFKAPSFGKKHKLQKTNSETELRTLKKMWSDFGYEKGNPILHNLTPHVEDDGENPTEHLSAANVTAEGNDNHNNLREQLFRKLVTKKSSNSLNTKKKSYPSNLLKIPHVFLRSNEEGTSEVVQTIDEKSFSNSLKGLELYKDGIITEMIDGSPQILAGTLEKLLSRLIDEEEKDTEFIDCFLLNHILFISSEFLLQEMINRYRIFNSRNDDDKLDIQQRTFLKNIISVLYRWVTIQPQDFQIDMTLRDSMSTFLTDEVTEEEFQSEVSKIKTILEIQSLISIDKIKNQRKSQSTTTTFTNTDNIPRPIISDSSPLLEFESKNIAKYLTLIDFAVLKSMTFFDITIWWKKRKALENSGSSNNALGRENQSINLIESHLDSFIRRSNMISHWIAHEICSLKTVKARRTLLHKFIETARYCREYNNFHIASCIALALNSRPVQRLVKTWESLSHQDIMTSQSIEELIDPSRNMRKYRKSLANAKPPVIPFFAIFLKDLTFIIEGNPTYIRNKHYISSAPSTPTISTYPDSRESSIPSTPTTPSFPPSLHNSLNSYNSLPLSTMQEPLINFEKFRFLTKNIRNINRYTSESYSFINQLSRPPKILTSNFSLLSDQPDLINTYNSLINNNLSGNGCNNSINNIFNNGGGGSKPAPLDHIGEVIERRMFAAAGSIFGDNVTISMLNGNELEAELMTLSLEAEPAVNVI